MSAKTWFAIKNAAADTAEISIYDVIGLWGVSARDFIRQLKGVTAKKIDLRIHSPGGDVMEGHAIYNALQRHPATITSHIDGMAASMASVVALAGETVCIAANGMMMIHNPSGGSCGGTAEDHRKSADILDKIKSVLVSAYEQKTNLPRAEIEEMMDDETWMTAQEALDLGFVDSIGGEMKVAATAHFDLSGFRNAPAALRIDTPPADSMKILTASLATLITAASGVTLTDASTEAEITSAIEALRGKLTTADAKVNEVQGKLTAADSRTGAIVALITSATAVATLSKESSDAEIKAALDKITGKITSLEAEKSSLTTKVLDLEKSSKTAEQHGAEIAAANGVNALNKGNTTIEGQKVDGKAIHDKYQAAMQHGRAAEAAEIWAKHAQEITDYVEAEERTQRRD
jgi:ATP-dependent Clp endopeptidase proteolytic subunit ClpP